MIACESVMVLISYLKDLIVLLLYQKRQSWGLSTSSFKRKNFTYGICIILVFLIKALPYKKTHLLLKEHGLVAKVISKTFLNHTQRVPGLFRAKLAKTEQSLLYLTAVFFNILGNSQLHFSKFPSWILTLREKLDSQDHARLCGNLYNKRACLSG